MDRTEKVNIDPVTGAKNNSKLARFDLIPADVLIALAERYGKGAEKYGDRNWELGFKYNLPYQAAMRHILLWWGGENIDEDRGSHHLVNAIWNLVTLLHFELNPDEYNHCDDRPLISAVKHDAQKVASTLEALNGTDIREAIKEAITKPITEIEVEV